MSATMETFLEIQKVTDTDCGNYRMGEIDFYPRKEVIKYISQYGEFGIHELQRCFHVLTEEAYKALYAKNEKESQGQEAKE